MQGFWLTVGWSLAALFAVSVLVALVEYLRQGPGASGPIESPWPKATSIDVDVDAWPAPAQPVADAPSDPQARQVALSETLERLQQADNDAAWTTTTPMVLSAQRETDPHSA